VNISSTNILFAIINILFAIIENTLNVESELFLA